MVLLLVRRPIFYIFLPVPAAKSGRISSTVRAAIWLIVLRVGASPIRSLKQASS